MTGLGYLNYHHEVCADFRDDVAYTSPDVDIEAHELGRQSGAYWCFPIHETCWQLLCLRLGVAGDEALPSVAHHLFYILYNTPTDGARLLLPGHDYGGVARFQDPGRNRTPIIGEIYNSDMFYIHHDPSDSFDFDLGHETETTTDDHVLVAYESELSDDIFRTLPSEIIMLILCHLPTGSIPHLRLSSRPVAVASGPLLLSQSFWASRFSEDNELAFVFADRAFVLPPEPTNWRQWYTASRKMLKEPRTYPGFQNRFRIWQTLDHILPALRIRLKNGKNIDRRPYTDGVAEPFGIRSPMAAAELSYEFPRSALRESSGSTELDVGCRLFQTQHLNWKKINRVETVLLGVSILHQNGRKYISGMRLLSVDGSETKNELDRVGFVDPTNEEIATINTDGSLRNVRVRVIVDGIIGLCLNVQGTDGVRSHVFGDFDRLDSDSGIAVLESETTLRTATFFAGLDVSLQTPEDTMLLKVYRHARLFLLELW